MLGERLERCDHPWADVALAKLKDDSGGYEKLVGVHKAVVPISKWGEDWDSSIDELESFLRTFDEDINFSVSVYAHVPVDGDVYEKIAADVLEAVRAAGLRKANLIRPKQGSEVLTKEIVSRQIIDIVILRRAEGERGREEHWVGVTSFIPDAQDFQRRSNERPVVSSAIAISSRLARLLVNLSGVKKGQTVLDPFCGSGTILSEALLVGADCIGIDRDAGRIENARRNLEWLTKTEKLSSRHFSLKVGDATRSETLTESVDAVVTEPIFLPTIDYAPDIEKARKLVRNSSRLYSESLYSLANVVKRGGRVVIVTPALRTSAGKEVSVQLENLEEEVGLRPFRPASCAVSYPVKISNEKTRWVRRRVYVLERA